MPTRRAVSALPDTRNRLPSGPSVASAPPAEVLPDEHRHCADEDDRRRGEQQILLDLGHARLLLLKTLTAASPLPHPRRFS